MNRMSRRMAVAFLLGALSAADAAPNIPPSELPGRERQRFQESPIDRFTQPGAPQSQQPLYRWNCDPSQSRKRKSRGKRSAPC